MAVVVWGEESQAASRNFEGRIRSAANNLGIRTVLTRLRAREARRVGKLAMHPPEQHHQVEDVLGSESDDRIEKKLTLLEEMKKHVAAALNPTQANLSCTRILDFVQQKTTPRPALRRKWGARGVRRVRRVPNRHPNGRRQLPVKSP